MNQTIYTLSMGSIATVFYLIFNKISTGIKVWSNKQVIISILIISIILSLFGFAAYLFPMPTMMHYFALQFIYLLLGVWAASYWNKTNANNSVAAYGSSVLFILICTLLGMLGFSYVFKFFVDENIARNFASCIVPFALPQCLKIAFLAYADVPNDIHKLWYYPMNYVDVSTDNINPDNALMLEVEFTKSIDEPYTNTKIKAPLEMKFGEWFMAYIDYHNEKFDNTKIKVLNEDGTPQGWMFYERASFFGNTKYIDAELSIQDNRLSEKKVIIAKRVQLHDDDNND